MKSTSYNNNPKDITLHTNAFAHAMHNSTSGRAYKVPSRVPQKRSLVRGYAYSTLGRAHAVRSNTNTHAYNRFSSRAQTQQGSFAKNMRQAHNAGAAPGASGAPQPRTQSFQEPTARGYNPLG